MELLQRKCPTCHSAVLQYHTTYATQHHGRRILDKCARCPRDFSETKKPLMAGVKTPVSVLWQVVKARTAGMGLHAAARTFEKATHTILAGERKLGDLPQVLFLSAWVHEFFAWVREGDDASTKVQKHVPPAQSPGGTIRVRDRASRVIWDRDCGKKARKRLHQAITSLDKIARQTHDLSLCPDGARRYGTLLCEICHALVNNGTPGRPKKPCQKGVHVRLKHTGSQAHKKGRKRPTYQSPWREQPATARPMAETDIHAPHAAAFLRALRRNWATCRRKTTRYAQSTTGLQRLLRVYWVVHNFLRVHFTTRAVPAVALGLRERRLSVQEIFQMQLA
jgi:hypothetical protein